MTGPTSILEEAEAEILDLVAAPEPDRRRILDVIRRIEALGEHADPDWASALGYFWYLMPGDDVQRVEAGERWLEQAVHLAPEHPLANLYLGHFAFDRGDMSRAVRHLAAIPAGHYEQRGQIWRALKIRELILAAGLREYAPDVSGLGRFMADYDATAEDNRAVPRELVEAAEATQGDPRTRELAARILDWGRA